MMTVDVRCRIDPKTKEDAPEVIEAMVIDRIGCYSPVLKARRIRRRYSVRASCAQRQDRCGDCGT